MITEKHRIVHDKNTRKTQQAPYGAIRCAIDALRKDCDLPSYLPYRVSSAVFGTELLLSDAERMA